MPRKQARFSAQDFVWYVECLTPLCNEIASKTLGEENACSHVLCSDRKYRDLWRADMRFVCALRLLKNIRRQFRLWKQVPKETAIVPHGQHARKRIVKRKKEVLSPKARLRIKNSSHVV